MNKYICVGYPTSKLNISNWPWVRASHPFIREVLYILIISREKKLYQIGPYFWVRAKIGVSLPDTMGSMQLYHKLLFYVMPVNIFHFISKRINLSSVKYLVNIIFSLLIIAYVHSKIQSNENG